MRFLTIIKCDENLPGEPPPALMAAITELGEQATKDGSLLDQGGLHSSAAGALVRVGDGKVTIIDGPFAEAKEVIGGYAMYQARTKDEAVEYARRFMALHAEHWPEFEGACEVRQVMGPEDFGPPAQG